MLTAVLLRNITLVWKPLSITLFSPTGRLSPPVSHLHSGLLHLSGIPHGGRRHLGIFPVSLRCHTASVQARNASDASWIWFQESGHCVKVCWHAGPVVEHFPPRYQSSSVRRNVTKTQWRGFAGKRASVRCGTFSVTGTAPQAGELYQT